MNMARYIYIILIITNFVITDDIVDNKLTKVKYSNEAKKNYIDLDIYTKRKPSYTYLHTIIQGYEDCNLDTFCLKKEIKNYTLDYNIDW